MAAPATKRRKIRHDSEGGSVSGEDDGMVVVKERRQGAVSKPPHKKPEITLQDGVYTAEVYKSNMFKLQVDELLQQVKFKYGSKVAPAEHAIHALKGVIEQLPSRAPLSIPEAEELLQSEGVAIPFPQPRPPKDAKYKLQFDRPASINVTGSFPLKVATKTDDNLGIDLVVTMPKTLFQDKDYLNHRYFYKRAYYLACLAVGIKASQANKFKLTFDCLNGNHLQPVIIVQSNGRGGVDDFSNSKCVIRILLAVPENTFAESKLRPTSNCVRPQSATDGPENKAAAPTPFYNATLQSDASVTAYLKLLHSASSKCDAFKDACILGRIWLKQRGFASRLRCGGFGNFEWAALMAILLQPSPGAGTPTLFPGYSSYQLFKATLQFLGKHNLSKTPFVFQAHDITFPKTPLAPMLFDGPRNLNLLYKMTPWSYSRLQGEAQSTVDMLQDPLADHFESAFILKTDLLAHHYDATLVIPLSSFGLDPTSEDYDQMLIEKCRKIHATLGRALTDRITSLSLFTPDEYSWGVGSSRPPEDQGKSILINAVTDPVNATRTVDLGPPAEDKKEAASFRQFWSEKAELRRFKDGSILESVVWSLKDSSTTVLEQIVRFIITKHLGANVAEGLKFTFDSFAHLIPSGRLPGQSSISAFSARMTAFANLEKDIRGLEGLPLHIRHLNAADPQLRYAEVEIEPMRTPASIIVQFEGSARWPDDLCAIQRTKIAFLLKLADLLSADKPSYTTRVGLENPSLPSQNQAFLDIFQPSGFSFRLRIHHDREATLLDRQLKDKSLDNQSRESAAFALAAYKRDFLQVPAHTQALQTLCTRYPALSPCIRLTKRWFASHLLSPHFSSELIELLVVRTFLQPYPWPVPSTATTGFLRTLLWISRWDWRHEPLIVDFSASLSAKTVTEIEGAPTGSLSSDEIKNIQTRFEAWRRIDPAMNRVVLFAATNLDTDGTTWSDRGKPEKVIAARMTSLAKIATEAVRAQEDRMMSILSGQLPNVQRDDLSPESLFVSQVKDYDVVIRLSPKFSEPTKKKAEPRFKNLEIQQGVLSEEEKHNVGYNPAACFAEDLQQIYGDAILWFWNPETLDTIAGIWNPVVTAQRPFKVKAGWNSVPLKGNKDKDDEQDESGVDIEINKSAICNEIKRLGGELVKGIEVRS